PTLLRQTCGHFNIDMDVPFEDLPAADRKLVLSGSKGETVDYVFKQDNGVTRRRTMPYEGIINNIERRYKESPSVYTRDVMSRYMREITCRTCGGYRLNEEARAVRIDGRHVGERSEERRVGKGWRSRAEPDRSTLHPRDSRS